MGIYISVLRGAELFLEIFLKPNKWFPFKKYYTGNSFYKIIGKLKNFRKEPYI